jgi:hypothetical protein
MLPPLNVPTCEVVLPVSGKKVRLKAFTVKEEKNFQIAVETGDNSDVSFLVKELLKESIVEGEKNPMKYALTDIIVMFLKVCELSKGKIVNLAHRCNNPVDGNLCGATITTDLDLSTYEITRDSDIDPKKPIHLHNDIYAVFRYPSLEEINAVLDMSYDMNNTDESRKKEEDNIRLITGCIDAVYKNDEVFNEYDQQEIYEWFLSFPVSVFAETQKFFNSAPSIKLDFDITCPRCGKTSRIELRTLGDFFESGIFLSLISL